MAQKPKKQIKHDNLDAQITVMKEELGVVNKELSKKLIEKDSLENELLSHGSELKLIKGKAIQLTEYISTIESENKIRTEESIKLQKKRNNDLKESELKLNDNKIEIRKLQTISNQLDTNIFLNKDNLLISNNQLQESRIIESELNIEIKNILKELSNHNNDLNNTKKQIVNDLLDFDKQLERKEKRLKELNEEILKNQIAIEEPTKSLKEENRKLDRKKKNLDVYIMRFNKTFKKHYPLQELKL